MKHSKRILIYKIIIVIFIIAAFVWPKFLAQEAEIDNRALATAIGIDINNDDEKGGVLASAQIIVPIPQGQQLGKQEVFFATGRTLAEALSNIDIKIGRILDFGQVGLVVIGEEKAEKGILEELKYLINNKVRAETGLFVANHIEARELLEKANKLTEEATSSLNNLLKFNAQSTNMPNINLLQFLSDSNVTDRSSFVPILEINSKEIPIQSDDKTAYSLDKKTQPVSGGGESGGEGSGETLNEIKAADKVFLFKNGRIGEKLDDKETRGLIWHSSDVRFGLVLAEDIKIDNATIEYLPCKLRGKTIKSKVSFENGIPVITYKFGLRFNCEDLHEINEKHNPKKPFSKSLANREIKEGIERIVRRDIELCMKKLQDADIDALGIRKEFFKFRNSKYKEYINENSGFLSKVEIRYQFNIKIY